MRRRELRQGCRDFDRITIRGPRTEGRRAWASSSAANFSHRPGPLGMPHLSRVWVIWVTQRGIISASFPSADGSMSSSQPSQPNACDSTQQIIVAYTTPGSLAAKKATSTIPIVTGPIGDPVANGIVASLARPGGNITGQSLMAPESKQ